MRCEVFILCSSLKVVTDREGEVPWLGHPVLARPDVVQVPEQEDEDQAEDEVAAPDIHQSHVIRAGRGGGWCDVTRLISPDYGLVHIGPVHPTGAGGLFEPHHDEAEGEAEVWDE